MTTTTHTNSKEQQAPASPSDWRKKVRSLADGPDQLREAYPTISKADIALLMIVYGLNKVDRYGSGPSPQLLRSIIKFIKYLAEHGTPRIRWYVYQLLSRVTAEHQDSKGVAALHREWFDRASILEITADQISVSREEVRYGLC